MRSKRPSIPARAVLRRALLAILGLTLALSGCRSAGRPAAPTVSPAPSRTGAPPVPTHTRPAQAAPTAAGSSNTRPSATPIPADPTATPLPWIEEPVVWLLRAVPQPGLEAVNEKLNQALAERGLNLIVELRMIEPARYEREVQRLWEVGAAPDLLSVGAGYAHYDAAVAAGQLLALTAYPNPKTGQEENLLEQRPALADSLPPAAWEAARRAGQVYAIPNQRAWVRPLGVAVRADVLEALDVGDLLDSAQSFEDLTPLFAAIQAAVDTGELEGNLAVVDGGQVRAVFGHANLLKPEAAGYDRLGSFFVVHYDDPAGRMVNWLETPEFRALAALRREWQAAGFGPPVSLPPDGAAEGYREGRFVVEVARPVAPDGGPAERYGYPWTEKALSPAFLSGRDVTEAMTAISTRTGEDPERLHRVLMLLELLRADAEIYNLVARGVEGVHWSWVGNQQNWIALPEEPEYLPEIEEQVGDSTLAYPVGESAAGEGEAARAWNRQAPPSPALGFFFDPRPAAAPYAQTNATALEQMGALVDGQAEPVDTAIEKLLKALREAGLDQVEAAVRLQYEAWRAQR